MILRALVLLSFASFSSFCFAQTTPWSSILSASSGSGATVGQAIDWSQTGLTSQGGIPTNRTQCGSTISSTGSDQSSAIQSAVSSCGSGQYVQLAAGTFTINTGVAVPANVTLKGMGADQTILSVHGTSGSAITLGSGAVSYTGPLSITSGGTAGSTSLTLSGMSGVTTGGYLVISETNDSAFVTLLGGEDSGCTWCDGWSTNGTRARGQIVEVESIAGSVVTIFPALYSDYTHTPTAVPFTATKFAGLEDLQIYDNNTGYTNDIYMTKCAYCWVKGVEVNYTGGDYVEVSWGFGDEIRNSYFTNAYTHAPGTTDADIFVDYKTSNSQIVSNILERSHAGIMLNWGAAGNVIAYNYTEGEYDTNAWNFVIGGIDMHGAHPQFNLVEGNNATVFYPDQVWGSSSNNTTFRNWFRGNTLACNPLTGRSAITCSTVGTHGAGGVNGWYSFQVSAAEDITHLATYYNFVGDIAGSATQQGVLSTHIGIVNWTGSAASRDGYSTKTWNMAFGYGESNDDGTGTSSTSGCDLVANGPCHGTAPYDTATIYKTYTFSNTTTNCIISGTSTTCPASLPASFYLSSKPSWWSNAVPWPAIGPDISGGTGPGGHASLTASNPAQYCFTHYMAGTEGGAGSPYTFNANTCYAPAGIVYPTGLIVGVALQ
jgi:hypothetical protein